MFEPSSILSDQLRSAQAGKSCGPTFPTARDTGTTETVRARMAAQRPEPEEIVDFCAS
jgi:hypothetical protein